VTPKQRARAIGAAWAVGTTVALIVTLPAVQPDKDFDWLNNMFQIPFALPWFLLPIGSRDHVRDAWVTAGFGCLNSVLVHFWVLWRSKEQR
jgi:hypothetical protein